MNDYIAPCRLWWTAALAASSALVIELAIWFVPQLLRASREPAYSMQFCLVLDVDMDTARITVRSLVLDAVSPKLTLYYTSRHALHL